MKTIKQYQKAFAAAANTKFSNNINWSDRDRLLSIQRQLADVGAALQIDDGIYEDKRIHNSTNHSIAALLVDVLLLVDMRNFDIDEELEKALDWFKP